MGLLQGGGCEQVAPLPQEGAVRHSTVETGILGKAMGVDVSERAMARLFRFDGRRGTPQPPRSSAMSSSTRRTAGSRAGRPTTGSGRGATRSSSASAGASTRTGAGTTTSTTTGRRNSCWPAAATAARRWSVEQPSPPGRWPARPACVTAGCRPAPRQEQPTPLDEPIDFTRPGFAMTVRMENSNNGISRYYYSYDRGTTWRGPYALPLFGQPGVMGRTDYIVNGREDCLLFLTASKANGKEGRPFCARTTDGGRTWHFLVVHRARARRAMRSCRRRSASPRPTSSRPSGG